MAYVENELLSLGYGESLSTKPKRYTDCSLVKFSCPWCHYEGGFEDGKVPFLVFGILDVGRERRRAKRTYVCPECRTEIVLPKEAKFMGIRQ